MNPERKMRRARDRVVARDLRLLEKYCMGDDESFAEIRRLYFSTSLPDRPAAMVEIQRHARACAFLVHRAKHMQGQQN